MCHETQACRATNTVQKSMAVICEAQQSVPICKHFLTKTRGFCKQRLLCQFSPESAGATFPRQCWCHPLLPCLPSVFFIPRSEEECARRHQRRTRGCSGSARQKADRQFLAPARQHPAMVGMDRPPQKCPCKVLRSLFSPPRADLKLILCTVPSPHINPTAAACQCGVWTEATLPCCCLPNICWHYCIALLWSFPVPPTTRKQYINTENPFNFEHTSYPMQLWPPRKRS